MKRGYFILSGFCACIIGSVLYFTQVPGNLEQFIFLLLIPSILTFAPMLWVILDRNGYKLKFSSIPPVPIRIFLMFLHLALMIFQFSFLVLWAISFLDPPAPIFIHFSTYFFLVGLVCSISMLYRLADLRRREQIS